jgi:hypothetical protein
LQLVIAARDKLHSDGLSARDDRQAGGHHRYLPKVGFDRPHINQIGHLADQGIPLVAQIVGCHTANGRLLDGSSTRTTGRRTTAGGRNSSSESSSLGSYSD